MENEERKVRENKRRGVKRKEAGMSYLVKYASASYDKVGVRGDQFVRNC